MVSSLVRFAERVIRTIRNECLDRFIVLGTRHPDYLLSASAFGDRGEGTHWTTSADPIEHAPGTAGDAMSKAVGRGGEAFLQGRCVSRFSADGISGQYVLTTEIQPIPVLSARLS